MVEVSRNSDKVVSTPMILVINAVIHNFSVAVYGSNALNQDVVIFNEQI